MMTHPSREQSPRSDALDDLQSLILSALADNAIKLHHRPAPSTRRIPIMLVFAEQHVVSTCLTSTQPAIVSPLLGWDWTFCMKYLFLVHFFEQCFLKPRLDSTELGDGFGYSNKWHNFTMKNCILQDAHTIYVLLGINTKTCCAGLYFVLLKFIFIWFE